MDKKVGLWFAVCSIRHADTEGDSVRISLGRFFFFGGETYLNSGDSKSVTRHCFYRVARMLLPVFKSLARSRS